MKKRVLSVFLTVAMVFAITVPAMADTIPVPTPQGGLSSFVASTPAYDDGIATFTVTITYGGGNSTSGTLSWSGDVGELTHTPLTTNTTGNPRRTTGDFTVEQICVEQTIAFVISLQTNQGPVTETINVNINGLGHDYVAVITDPTCTEEGFTTYTCAVCGDFYTGDNVGALGHDYVAIVTDPTCTGEGFTTYTCTVCDDEYVSDKVVANGHDYVGVVTAPTCTEEGFTTYTCADCDDSYTGDNVAAKGHDYIITEVIPMTHKSEGYTIYTCTRCDDSYNDDYVEAVPYKWEVVIIVAPTCTEKGYTIYEDTFWKKTKKSDWVKATGHDCVGVVTVPTCTKEGLTNYTCINANCDYTYIGDKVPANGHYYVGVVTAPTCMLEGFTAYTCSFCDDGYIGDKESALGHDYVGVVTDPTCTDEGFKTYTCSVCDDGYIGDTKEALGHKYIEVITAPTCTDGGYTVFVCMVCAGEYVDDYTNEEPCGNCDACNPKVAIIGASNAKFISIAETAKNSRVWVLTFDVTVKYSNNTTGIVRYTINLNGNNANLDGKYIFGADQDLAGMTLTYDIKGNGSNIKAFIIK